MEPIELQRGSGLPPELVSSRGGEAEDPSAQHSSVGPGSIRLEPAMQLTPPPAYRVLESDFSRNRHFDWYESAEGRTMRPFRRIIQGLLADLERTTPAEPITVTFDPDTGRVWLELKIQVFRAVRRACLHAHEFEALKTHPVLGPRMKAHI